MKPLRLIVLTVLLLATPACGGDAGEEGKNAKGRVEVQDFRYVRLPGGARIVMGKLHNRSAEPINAAQLRIHLYDADNLLVTTMNVVVRHIEPGEYKPFRQMIDTDEDVRGARVRSVLIL